MAYVGCGLNQLSPIKDRCLQHCRSPLSLFFHYSLFQGRLRDLRVGAHHGADCLGCCWALRVVTEKPWSRGERFSRLVGIASLALAVATIWFPVLAAGFSPMM